MVFIRTIGTSLLVPIWYRKNFLEWNLTKRLGVPVDSLLSTIASDLRSADSRSRSPHGGLDQASCYNLLESLEWLSLVSLYDYVCIQTAVLRLEE